MENPGAPKAIHPKIRELVDFTMIRCAAAIQHISAYKLSLAELGAIREVISVAIKTAFYRGMIAKDEDETSYLEPWNADNDPTDIYVRSRVANQLDRGGLWDAIKRRANRRYADRSGGSSAGQLLRDLRSDRPGNRENL